MPIAITAGLLTAVVIAGMFQIVVLRRIREGPVLAKVIGTLGLLILIEGVINGITGSAVPNAPALFPEAAFTLPIGHPNFVVGQGPFWVFVISLVATATLSAVFRWTRFGIITRALGENETAVTLTGTSAQRMALANWCFGALLAGGAGILISTFAPISSTLFTTALITAIAAALVGGLRSFWVTWIAALAIALAQPILSFYDPDLQQYLHVGGWADVLPILVILVIVVVRGSVLPLRDSLAQALLPRVRIPQRPIRAVLVALLAGLAWFTLMPASLTYPMATTLIGAILCLSLVVTVGFVGQISLAQMAFAGMGAFSTAIAAEKIAFPWCLIVGAMCAVPVGIVIGFPSLRVRGMQLAVVTLAAGLALEDMLFNSGFSGGDVGRSLRAAKLGPLSMNGVTQPRAFGVLCLVIFCIAMLGVAYLRRSRFGQRFLAVRVNERGASASGVSVTRTKVLAFALSSFIAGIAGGLLAYQTLLISGAQFDVFDSILVLGDAYIGGIASLAGAFLGGAFAPGGIMSYLGNLIWNSGWNQALAGVALLTMVANHPDGLAGLANQVRRARKIRRARMELVNVPGQTQPNRPSQCEPTLLP